MADPEDRNQDKQPKNEPDEVMKQLRSLLGDSFTNLSSKGVSDMKQGFAKAMILAEILPEYRKEVADILPIIAAAPELAEMVVKDFTPLLTAIITGINTVGEDDDLKVAAAKLRENKAKGKFAVLQTYMDAGFTREEAMEMILQSMQKSPRARTAPPLSAIKGILDEFNGTGEKTD